MRVLGIDTSSRFLSIALAEGKVIVAEESYLLERRHSSLLIPKIKKMLKRAAFSIYDVDAFVVGLGPGSFTGLRIGVSTVKGFGIATKKPCIGIASIDALALNAKWAHGSIVPIIDAKRKNVYSAIYKKGKSSIVRKSSYMLSGLDELMKKVKGDVIFLGDGIDLYRKGISSQNKKAVFLEEKHWYPHAGNLIRLALPKIKRHRKYSLNELEPIYLYPKDCQVKKN